MTVERNADSGPARGNLSRFPLLPLRDIVVFPGMVIPLYIGREKSILALESAVSAGREIFLAAQSDPQVEDPGPDEINPWGTVCSVVQILKLPDGTVKALLEGKQRGCIRQIMETGAFLTADVVMVVEDNAPTTEAEALMRGVKETFSRYAKLAPAITDELVATVTGISEPGRLADAVVPHLSGALEVKQELLALADPVPRLERIMSLLIQETEVIQLEKKIQSRVKKQVEKNQKEYYLNEQMRAIRKELGDKDDHRQEMQELEVRLAKSKLSKDAKQKVSDELKKLRLMSPASAEAAVIRNYVEWLLCLPWRKFTREKLDLSGAEAILDRDHYGLEKVKERIIEYLSVLSLVGKIRGPILCLVGPPGVGKTSLARSVATATGRKFVKMSLGGVRDEAEIRGHRRTYVGAMPGRIIQGMKKAGTANPVFLMDEIDKLGNDFRGDPASALLEVLDPEQNCSFSDHFLDVEYDLSSVMFITTANSLHSIPRPLLDRLEVIQLSGYTESEKVMIAKNYLIPKQRDQHGLKEEDIILPTDTIREVVRYYTREAGVRNLERELAALCRKRARDKARGSATIPEMTPDVVRSYLGVVRYSVGNAEESDAVGLVNGLAWTEAGGELLSVEVSIMPGKGNLTVTGKLGDTMQESARAALSYVRSRFQVLGLDRDFYQSCDIHIHLPEGAIPKDGPSAGITMATAIASALAGVPVRHELAMTGEITLRGRVLPIGGLKEKLLAAKRGGITQVLIPALNTKDLSELTPDILDGLTVQPVTSMDEVLALAMPHLAVSSESRLPSVLTQNREHDCPVMAH